MYIIPPIDRVSEDENTSAITELIDIPQQKPIQKTFVH